MLDIEDQPTRAEETAKGSLTRAAEDPWETDCIEGVLKALVHSINSQGVYDDSLGPKTVRTSTKPLAEFAPAVILRKRSAKGLTETLKRIKEQIENGQDIPGEFADLAECRPKNDRETGDGHEAPNNSFDGEVFFPKPSNDEQRRIVNKIRSASGVLVQGPPGTGKSHTIANLICHLLATGNRILVTAKTPRALQVLLGEIDEKEGIQSHEPYKERQRDNGLIPKEIKPLCISLLGSGQEERKSLEASVGGILRKNEEWKPADTDHQREELEKRLRELREEKARVNLIFPRFRGHVVTRLPPSLQTRLERDSRGSNADAADCRTPRCIRRCPVSLPLVWHSADGTRVPASMFRRSSRHRRCPSNCRCGSCWP